MMDAEARATLNRRGRMQEQISRLMEIQRLLFAKDECLAFGELEVAEELDRRALAERRRLGAAARDAYSRVAVHGHHFMSALIGGGCACCGMRVEPQIFWSIQDDARFVICSGCGRLLYMPDASTPRLLRPLGGWNENLTGFARFCEENLVLPDMDVHSAAEAISCLSETMRAAGYLECAADMTAAALAEEKISSSARGNGIAIARVRGVEGGGVVLSLGVCRAPVDWDGLPVRLVILAAIPAAFASYFNKLSHALVSGLSPADRQEVLFASRERPELWKNVRNVLRFALRHC